MDGGIVAVLLLGFGLGLVHALDADHVMAVSALASLRPRLSQCFGFALRWGLGHGATLLLLGGSALVLGVALPPSLAEGVERIVGVVMVALGAWVAIGRVGSVSPQSFFEGNLNSITAVVIGGTSLFGGRGSILGALIGELIVGIVASGLKLAGVDVLWQRFAIGCLIIAAAALDQWIRKISA